MRRLSRSAGFAATALAFAVGMLGTTLPTPLYELYRQKFGFSELMITVIFAIYAAGVIASLLLFGRLSDQIGRRRVLLGALAVSALSAIVFLVADSLPLLIAGRILSGLSSGIFTGTATATLVDLAPTDRVRRATLVATIANMGGLGVGPLLAGALSQWAGSPIRLVFWVDLALLVVVAIGIWAMPEPVQRVEHPTLRPRLPRISAELRPTFIRAALAGFAGFAVLGLFTAVAPAFLAQELGVTSRAAIGAVVCALFAASAVGQALLGRVPESRALPIGCAGLIAGMALIAAALGASSLGLLIAGAVVAGIGQGMSFRAGLSSINARALAAHRAEVASSFFIVAYVAISVPVVGEGALAQATGLRTAGIVFAAAVATVSATVLILLAGNRDRRGRSLRLASPQPITR